MSLEGGFDEVDESFFAAANRASNCAIRASSGATASSIIRRTSTSVYSLAVSSVITDHRKFHQDQFLPSDTSKTVNGDQNGRSVPAANAQGHNRPVAGGREHRPRRQARFGVIIGWLSSPHLCFPTPVDNTGSSERAKLPHLLDVFTPGFFHARVTVEPSNELPRHERRPCAAPAGRA